jgi:hypothetical protein
MLQTATLHSEISATGTLRLGARVAIADDDSVV